MKKQGKRRLTIEDRMIIQACLHDSRNLAQIATRLNVSKSTISREISKFSYVKLGYKCSCAKKSRLDLCNGCQYSGSCLKEKRFYNFKTAEEKSSNLRSSPRSKSKLPIDDIKVIDAMVTDGVRLGQSLHHIYASNPSLSSICGERTIRRLVYRGNLSIKPHELRRYVTYKHSYKKSPKELQLRDIRVLIGRTFKDYKRKVLSNKRSNVVQYDSVIGCISDKKAILTVTFPKYNFQFGILINKGSPDFVRTKIRKLFAKLGKDKVKRIFPINLADNGVEFSYFNEIEIFDDGDKVCDTFFTNPYKSTDKAECERNHEFIRYMIPKGKSLDFLTQEKVDDMFSNINSYVRKSKKDSTPYDLVLRKFEKEFLDAIGIKRIPKKKVKLTQIV
jgi:IS30 family transposase